MDILDYLYKKAKELNNLFIYHDKKLIYDNETQEAITPILEEIAEITQTFDSTIANEENNIDKELTIDGYELIDKNSLNSRVRDVLKINNMYTCLKSLALSNKCAHSLDNEIDSIEDIFKNFYNLAYGKQLGNITFMEKIKYKFPKIEDTDLYNIEGISDYDLKKIFNTLFRTKNIKINAKISILNNLKIPYKIKDDGSKDIKDINLKFDEVLKNKYKIADAVLYHKYDEGYRRVNFQNSMFVIKSNLIIMIGQLLKDNRINLDYQLVKTPGVKKGFEHMLIIDDKELSYLIEVHMPDYIADIFVKDYGFQVENRTFPELGASAIYRRRLEEIKKMVTALNEHSISTDDGIKRAKIIVRGHNDSGDDGGVSLNNSEENFVENPSDGNEDTNNIHNSQYTFITDEFINETSPLESFLIIKGKFLDEVDKNIKMKHNENYSIYEIKEVINNRNLVMFDSLNDIEKNNFVEYALNEDNQKDEFDEILSKQIKKHNCDTSLAGKIIICKNILKENFINDNYDRIKEIINNKYIPLEKEKNKEIINNKLNILASEYIDNTLENYNEKFNKENNNGKGNKI